MSTEEQSVGHSASEWYMVEKSTVPAFKTIWFGYTFLARSWRNFFRLAWRDYLYSLGLLFAAAIADHVLFGTDSLGGLYPVIIPAAGFFVLRFAVRWHRALIDGEWWPERLDGDTKDESIQAVGAYCATVAVFVVILAIPLAPPFIMAFLGIGESIWLPLVAAGVALDFYLAARLSIFLPAVAIGNRPHWWYWKLSRGVVWKLILIVALAPWPFNTAVKLLNLWIHEAAAVHWQVASVAVQCVLSFAAVAALAASVTLAYVICTRRNEHLIEKYVNPRPADEVQAGQQAHG